MKNRGRIKAPRCFVIAGPNGAGKTTFARELLPKDAGVVHFINADLIAGGLSPFKPELAARAAARLLLREIDRLARERQEFGFETTLSGLAYARRLQQWRDNGFLIEMVYLRLSSVKLALQRVAGRVRQGGHNVPSQDVIRRFARSWVNFEKIYCPLAHVWTVYDNSGVSPQFVESGECTR